MEEHLEPGEKLEFRKSRALSKSREILRSSIFQYRQNLTEYYGNADGRTDQRKTKILPEFHTVELSCPSTFLTFYYFALLMKTTFGPETTVTAATADKCLRQQFLSPPLF